MKRTKKRIETTHVALFEHLAKRIAKRGRVIIAVSGTKKAPPFFYTIGNQEKSLPELLLIGNFKPEGGGIILNELSERMRTGKAVFADGELVSLGGEYPVRIHNAGPIAKAEYTFQAGQFYANEDYQVQQVIMPDKAGYYPGDALCHKDFRVPVLRKVK